MKGVQLPYQLLKNKFLAGKTLPASLKKNFFRQSALESRQKRYKY